MRSSRRLAALAAALAAAGGCADIAGFDNNPQMRPGQDCLACHSATGLASGLNFTLGGTIYPAAYAGTEGGLGSAEIDVVDHDNRKLALLSNGAGNFYSAEPIVFPITVSVKVGQQRFTMQSYPPNGHCNACHSLQTNPDGTVQTVLLPAFGLDAGFDAPPVGHIYGFAGNPCAAPAPTACPTPAPSYKNQVQSIVNIDCYLCHNDVFGSAPPIESYPIAKSIDDVTNCVMPIAADLFPISPDQRQILLAWMQCGEPENN